MRLQDVNELMNYRITASKTQTVDDVGCPIVTLYGVVNKLNKPVITFVRMSKRYLYDESGNKFPYKYGYETANDWPMAIFTTEHEAWRFFKEKSAERLSIAEDFFMRELKILKAANDLIAEKAKDFPEYFI